MMNFSEQFPQLSHLVSVVSIGLTEKELMGLTKREAERHADLKLEIFRAFEDPEFSWKEILNHPDFGEVFDSETEEMARDFATKMFLKPALQAT
ncbi:MAG: hypothetical protein AAF231_01360 [Pseudomonadota bacterium]